jgi:MarR family transcriptional regulator, organic hydroperoxide resistance regulator
VPPDVLQTLRSFRAIMRSLKQQFQQVQDSTGVSGSQLWCVSALRAAPGLRVTQLAHELGIRQATASNLVEALERKGLIERRRDPADQRAVALFLTAKGTRLARSAPQPVAGILPQALEKLDPHTLSQLNELLLQVVHKMEGGRDATAPATSPRAAPGMAGRAKKSPA